MLLSYLQGDICSALHRVDEVQGCFIPTPRHTIRDGHVTTEKYLRRRVSFPETYGADLFHPSSAPEKVPIMSVLIHRLSPRTLMQMSHACIRVNLYATYAVD